MRKNHFDFYILNINKRLTIIILLQTQNNNFKKYIFFVSLQFL